MTNFVTDLQSTTFWRLREAKEAKRKIEEELDYTIAEGLMRWNSNNRVVPTEWYELAAYLGYDVDIELCDNTSRAEIADFLNEYCIAQAERSPEEIAEQRAMATAALGEGEKIVNIFTGEKFTT